ncbi:restriction endonuclease subunit S [Myxococcus sp. XM-1-1-1]|uniref:restriction endonuclease subunit S n=1 Tax=Myxococcus sp. XM-1-1-1 TaxID=2874602 RepID=UPI001CBDB0D6|nr:restriction endonuclease subunit S [Myxococcus sp. XM-1-1-1]MBZ4414690.1 restriction endonuclease subunit S [Myxococcus sp. XM-1-1-1]
MTTSVALERVARVFNGKTPAKTDQRSQGHPVLKIRDIDDDGQFRGSYESFVEPHFAEQFRDRMVREGDTLILNAAHNADYVASKIALAGAEVAGSLATGEWLVIRPTDADARFVHYWVRSLGARRSLRDLVKGIHLYPKDVARLLIPAPPLAEQRRIADILDKADAIRRKRKEAISLIEELLCSAFLGMFGDPVTNPKGWPTETIDELCARGAGLVDGPFGSSLKPEHYVDAGVKVVRNWNIYDDRFDFSEFKYVTPAKFEEIRRSEVLPGDVLITTKGTVGDVCVAPDLGGPAVLSASGTVRLRVPPGDSFLPEFIVAQMTTPTYKRYLHTFEAGSAQQYLNLSAIRKMRLIRPPVEAQGAFRAFRARVRHAHADAAVAHTESDHLFSSLVEHAFSRGPAC